MKEHEHILCCEQVCQPMEVQDTNTLPRHCQTWLSVAQTPKLPSLRGLSLEQPSSSLSPASCTASRGARDHARPLDHTRLQGVPRDPPAPLQPLTLVDGQRLGVVVPGIGGFHHVLADGQSGCLQGLLPCPPQGQLLQGTHGHADTRRPTHGTSSHRAKTCPGARGTRTAAASPSLLLGPGRI